VFEII